ncbi:MAG: hypothetical protein IKQ94_01375 [Bacteroidales bacterium]|nr:hypothetical protein [Bacteroidales bacterium]
MKIEKVHTKPHYCHGTKCVDSGFYGQSSCRNIVSKLLNIKLLPLTAKHVFHLPNLIEYLIERLIRFFIHFFWFFEKVLSFENTAKYEIKFCGTEFRTTNKVQTKRRCAGDTTSPDHALPQGRTTFFWQGRNGKKRMEKAQKKLIF